MNCSKYMIDTEENKAFLKENARRLLEFGQKFPSPGGSSYYLGDDGTPWKERPRETWITSRMAHVYSLGKMLGFEEGDKLASKAIEGLLDELKDKENGGWYSGIAADGSILPGKQCYAHAFVILAATSGVQAKVSNADVLLNDALKLYDDKFWREDEGMAVDTWNTEFTALDTYRGLNANMHTVEAFLAVADVTGDEKYRVRAGRIIDRVLVWAKENDWRIPEHFTEEWQPNLQCNIDNPADPFKPYGATPGHGIEWARLIIQWALSTYGDADNAAASYIESAEALYNRAVGDAWKVDGAPGLVYTTDWKGNPVVHDRMHWTLAEAINTSSVLYRVTHDPKYAGQYAEFMQYLDEVVLDHETGSWFHQLDAGNKLIGTVWPGKSDIYHAFQAMLIPGDVSSATAIALCHGYSPLPRP